MNTSGRKTDLDLNSYVDGELDAPSRAELETWLSTHPDDAARVDAYRKQISDLHGRFDDVLDQAVPAHLTAILSQPVRTPARPVWMQIAASLVILLTGAVGGWGLHALHDRPQGRNIPDFVERAVGAHIVYASEVRHPVEVAANQEDHLVAWLSNRLGHPFRVPRLAPAGYNLVGGRLLGESGLPAAQLMYEDNGGRRITVFVNAHTGRNTAFKFVVDHGISAFYWIEAPYAFALSGEIPRGELLRLATLVYEDLAK